MTADARRRIRLRAANPCRNARASRACPRPPVRDLPGPAAEAGGRGPGPLEEVAHARGGGLAAQGGQDVEGVLGPGQLGVGHRLGRHGAQALDENAGHVHRHQSVVGALEHVEGRRAGVDPEHRRRVPVDLGMFGEGGLHDGLLEHLDHAGPVAAGHVGCAGHVEHAVEGDAGLDGRVGVLEAGLEGGVAGREGQERAEVAAGRAATDRDEPGVAPVLGDVLLDPGQGPLAVDDVVGPRRFGA